MTIPVKTGRGIGHIPTSGSCWYAMTDSAQMRVYDDGRTLFFVFPRRARITPMGMSESFLNHPMQVGHREALEEAWTAEQVRRRVTGQ